MASGGRQGICLLTSRSASGLVTLPPGGPVVLELLSVTGSLVTDNTVAGRFSPAQPPLDLFLSSLGMKMLPPVTVAMPFKLLLFVLVNGWGLIITALVASYA